MSRTPWAPVRSGAALRSIAVLGLALPAVAAAPAPAAVAAESGAAAASPTGGAAFGGYERVKVHSAPHNVLAGRSVRLKGRLASGRRNRPVVLQLRAGRRWHTVDRARSGRGGSFSASWRAARLGRHALRARVRGGGASAAGRPRVVRVYRASLASWFGPGFYGRRTACGQILGAGALGVAHKGLPCGTRVTFVHGRRSVTVPVIDRGPFVGNREWDLTAATRARLGFPSTGTVWSSR